MRIHFTGACGRAIGSLALELKNQGWTVSASDENQWPPMDKVLRDGGLNVYSTFVAGNVAEGVELLVVSALITEDNPEVQAARSRGIPIASMAGFLKDHLLPGRQRYVVSGTNGKTTTTTMLAWILKCARKPFNYLFAGSCPGFKSSVRFRGARCTVLEGDEFPASADESVPKFLYYDPKVLLVTNIEFDHVEVYRDLEEILSHFRVLIETVPRSGHVIVADTCANSCLLAQNARAQVTVVGLTERADAAGRIRCVKASRAGMAFSMDGVDFRVPAHGVMNVRNAAMAVVAARVAGVDPTTAALALAQYPGVVGRIETLVDKGGATLVVDQGYHPGALRENIAALRARFPGRRLLVALQPRFTGGRTGYQMESLPIALADADSVILAEPFDLAEFDEGPFCNTVLEQRLKDRGCREVRRLEHLRSLPTLLLSIWKQGDVLLACLPPSLDTLALPLKRAILEWVDSTDRSAAELHLVNEQDAPEMMPSRA